MPYPIGKKLKTCARTHWRSARQEKCSYSGDTIVTVARNT